MSDSDKDWGFSLQHPDNAPRASGRANEGRQAVSRRVVFHSPAEMLNYDEGYGDGYGEGVARCIKVLTEYRDALTYGISATPNDRRAVTRAIDVLEAATPSPVASSPVGGEQ